MLRIEADNPQDMKRWLNAMEHFCDCAHPEDCECEDHSIRPGHEVTTCVHLSAEEVRQAIIGAAYEKHSIKPHDGEVQPDSDGGAFVFFPAEVQL